MAACRQPHGSLRALAALRTCRLTSSNASGGAGALQKDRPSGWTLDDCGQCPRAEVLGVGNTGWRAQALRVFLRWGLLTNRC